MRYLSQGIKLFFFAISLIGGLFGLFGPMVHDADEGYQFTQSTNIVNNGMSISRTFGIFKNETYHYDVFFNINNTEYHCKYDGDKLVDNTSVRYRTTSPQWANVANPGDEGRGLMKKSPFFLLFSLLMWSWFKGSKTGYAEEDNRLQAHNDRLV